jgi:hypothetical protein
MDLAREKIMNAKLHLDQAFNELILNNKRMSIGKLDEVNHSVEAAIHILINMVKDEEGKF